MPIMRSAANLADLYGQAMEKLSRAFARGDADDFHNTLDGLADLRERRVCADIRGLTESLLGSLEHFRQDSRIADLAEKEMPDARARLNHVLSLTDNAAHRTMDLIDTCGPLVDGALRNAEAFGALLADYRQRDLNAAEKIDLFAQIDMCVADSRRDCQKLRSSLNEIVLTQGYQDLSGQIIRNVISLVADVEGALEKMTGIAGRSPRSPASRDGGGSDARGHGPAIPGVTQHAVAQQTDVDDLMAGLGI
jgi:chemotaxis protein CheZ